MKIKQCIILLAISTSTIPASANNTAQPIKQASSATYQAFWPTVTILGACATGTLIYLQREKIKALFTSDIAEKEIIRTQNNTEDTILSNSHEDFTQEEKMYVEKLSALSTKCKSTAQAESTMLTQFIAQKNIKMMRYLLEQKKINPNVINKGGVRPLYCIAMMLENCKNKDQQQIYEDMMLLLLDHGAEPTKRCFNTQDSANIRNYCSQRIKQKISPSLRNALGVHDI